MTERALMLTAARLLDAVRLRHGDGIDALVTLARTLSAAIAHIDPMPRPLRRRRGRKAERNRRRKPVVENAAPPIAVVAEKKVSQPPPAAPAPTAANGIKVAAHGIKVTLATNAEAIEFAGRETEITTKQAQLLALLAAGTPNPIGRQFISDKLWPGRRADIQEVYLGGLVTETRMVVESIGLVLKTVRGVGVALQKAEPA